MQSKNISLKIESLKQKLVFFGQKGFRFSFFLTLLRIGVGGGAPPTSFLPVTSTNVGIRPKNFLTFSFNPSATLV